jgi:ABC-type iron transport system FetAB ATPase subunit
VQGTKASFLQLPSFQLPPSVPRANILLLGPPGAGKSSLVSTLDSLLSGALTRRADYGESTASLTLALRRYTFTAGGASTVTFCCSATACLVHTRLAIMCK